MDRTKVQYDFICDSDSNGIPEEEIKSLGGRVYKVAPYKNLIPHLKETYKILKENQYEVVHAFDNTLNIFPMFLARIAGVKVRISESISKGDEKLKMTDNNAEVIRMKRKHSLNMSCALSLIGLQTVIWLIQSIAVFGNLVRRPMIKERSVSLKQ